ncbi:hypothetical protein [Otariodibacter sp.]|uniref:hypothetical protein n=1 Tax=Otariodibacter sp. TaxID=3030919 RepID=UPI002631F661|nr:hypothetical protein [Otariodibacter sp.]
MDQRKEFAKNLKAILEKKGIEPKASVLEREFNLHHYGKPISSHAVARWLRGEVIPSFARIKTLASWLDVQVSELVSEDIAYKINKIEQQKEPTEHIWKMAASYQDQLLFETFLNLPQEQKKAVREVIIAMHKAYREK